MKIIYFIAFLVPILIFASCSSSNNCSSNENFRIDFYSGGGFTGIETGITISCEGWAKLWKKFPNSTREVTKTIKLTTNQLKSFNKFINDTSVFSYHSKYAGNYTTYLLLIKGVQINRISFNQNDLPVDFPQGISGLISEIENIEKNKD